MQIEVSLEQQEVGDFYVSIQNLEATNDREWLVMWEVVLMFDTSGRLELFIGRQGEGGCPDFSNR